MAIAGIPTSAVACERQHQAELLGTVRLALGAVPPDVLCVQLRVTDGFQAINRSISAAPGQTLGTVQSGLPVGRVEMGATAYNAACAEVTSTSVATWVSAQVSVTLVASMPVAVTLTMSRPGNDGGAPDRSPSSDAEADAIAEVITGPEDDPGTVVAMIGPAGGALAVEGALLSIPSGALAGMTEIRIEPGDATIFPGAPLTAILQLEPSGMTFSQPIRVALDVLAPIPPGAGMPVVFWEKADGTFEELPGRIEGGKIIAENTHFSLIGAGLPSPAFCVQRQNCGKMKCACGDPQGVVLCKTPNEMCTTDQRDFIAPGAGFDCQAFEFTTMNRVVGKTRICEDLPGTPSFCTIQLSRSLHGEAAQHVQDVIGLHQEFLTLARDDTAAKDMRRRQARARFKVANGGEGAGPGKQIDEYPPAMTLDGGDSASVRAINASDNMSGGVCAGAQVGRGPGRIPDGTVLKFEVVP